MSTSENHDGWDLHTSGPAGPTTRCCSFRVDPPRGRHGAGSWGTQPLEKPTMENAVKRVGELASDLGCDAVVGHSLGGTLALEMVAAGEFSGPVALLEPAFSREDEYKELGILDRIGRVPGLGHLAWVAAGKAIGSAMKGELPPDRHDALDELTKRARRSVLLPREAVAQTASAVLGGAGSRCRWVVGRRLSSRWRLREVMAAE